MLSFHTKIRYAAKLILCVSFLHVIGKPLYAINDCASYFSIIFPLAFLPPFPFLLATCDLENFSTIVRQTSSFHIKW